MTYNAIGLMSGSSLDGLDICFVRLTEAGGHWSYEWLATDCLLYSEEWIAQLKGAHKLSVPEFLRLHTAYGHFTGKLVKSFLQSNKVTEVDFIASHGHTVFHEPHNNSTFQIGDGASIAAETGIPVIAALRNMDVALGGQGAPIVPIGDKLLFGDYEYLLNLGGIANISVQRRAIAFDICPCNQLLNYYAEKLGLEYDKSGLLARSGKVDKVLAAKLHGQEYYALSAPKSLANDFSTKNILPLIDAQKMSLYDALATSVAHITERIAAELKPFASSGPAKLLTTGGGACNTFLIEELQKALKPLQIEVVIPDAKLVQYKEALIMALIGALRWRNEPNVLASVTGAKCDSIGGAIWAGRP